MGEQVGRAPQQAHAGLLLEAGGPLHQLGQVGRRLGERGSGRGHVDVVEAVERHAELGEELEGGVLLGPGRLHRVGARRQPRPVEGAGAEDVEPVPVEAVPVADGEAEMVFHAAAGHHPVLVVPAERQRIVRVGTEEGDGAGDVGEELGHALMVRLSGPGLGLR